jgi:hypothetical protein
MTEKQAQAIIQLLGMIAIQQNSYYSSAITKIMNGEFALSSEFETNK